MIAVDVIATPCAWYWHRLAMGFSENDDEPRDVEVPQTKPVFGLAPCSTTEQIDLQLVKYG